MEEEATSSLVRQTADGYEVSLESPTILLNECWTGAEVVEIECLDEKKVSCNSMVEHAVQAMLRKLNIDTENGQVKLDEAAVQYLVGRAKFGKDAWKDSRLKFSIKDEDAESARKEALDKVKQDYSNRTGEVEISCSDGFIPVHRSVAVHFKVVENMTGKLCLPISHRQLAIITDLVYDGKTSFKRSELAGVYVATRFCNLEKIHSVGSELWQKITEDWTSALSIDSIGDLDPINMVMLCSHEDFVANENYPEIASTLERWAGESLTRKTMKDSLLALLQANTQQRDEPKDYTKFIYYNNHKFDGTLWTVSELHKESGKHFSYTNAVVNSMGDRIVSTRPGPIGILSTTKGFISSDYHLPHDPLGYGYPYTFQYFPYVCLVFNVYDNVLKHFATELWQWKGETTFEPIKCSPMWDNVGNMVRVKEDLFYLTGRRRRPEVTVDATWDSESYQDNSKHEAGLYLMKVKRLDGILHGELEMVERWTLDEYAEQYNIEFFCLGGTLYKQKRDFDFKKCESSPTALFRLEDRKFIPANDFQPVEGAMLQTWTLEGRVFAVASLYDNCNSSCPWGFFELTDSNNWQDRTLETGFFYVCPNWKPANDSAWRNFI